MILAFITLTAILWLVYLSINWTFRLLTVYCDMIISSSVMPSECISWFLNLFIILFGLFLSVRFANKLCLFRSFLNSFKLLADDYGVFV